VELASPEKRLQIALNQAGFGALLLAPTGLIFAVNR
jgi:hypothetical protein